MNTKPMKEAELREFAECAKCGRKVGETKLPIFYTVTIARHGVLLNAVQRQAGLEMMLGSPGLAQVMSPAEDMTRPLMDTGTVMICEECGGQNMCVHELAGYVNEKLERATKSESAAGHRPALQS